MEKISDKIVGLTFDPTDFQWGQRDVILYALGVGATPPKDLDYVYEGKGPRVLPTYAVIPGMLSMGGLIGKVEINLGMLLHGEQGITLAPRAPSRGQGESHRQGEGGVGQGEGGGGRDRGRGPGQQRTARDDLRRRCSSAAPVASAASAGRRPRASTSRPTASPTMRSRITCCRSRARSIACRAIPNPMHIDPEFAKNFGFEAPFLHGLGTYGIVGRAILGSVCGNDPARFTSFSARFADRVMYEDDIITKIWVTGPGRASSAPRPRRATSSSRRRRPPGRTEHPRRGRRASPRAASAASHPMKLYAHPFSSYCQKVLIPLYENGIAFELRLLGEEQANAEQAALWPLKRMPVLVDAGRTVVEATIIVEYLDLHHPGPVRMIPADPRAALDVRMMDRFFDNYVMTPMQKVVGDSLRAPEHRDAFGVGEARALPRDGVRVARRRPGGSRMGRWRRLQPG
jgi:hypothetical protein